MIQIVSTNNMIIVNLNFENNKTKMTYEELLFLNNDHCDSKFYKIEEFIFY
jgi:hypothetical protein